MSRLSFIFLRFNDYTYGQAENYSFLKISSMPNDRIAIFLDYGALAMQ